MKVLMIGLGGFVGALLRYGVSGMVQSWSRSAAFPYGTLAVNVIGCLVIGILGQLAESRGMFGVRTRAFIFIGMLGAFTTFSTFGNETLNLATDGSHWPAVANVAANIIFCLAAVWLGRNAAAVLWR